MTHRRPRNPEGIKTFTDRYVREGKPVPSVDDRVAHEIDTFMETGDPAYAHLALSHMGLESEEGVKERLARDLQVAWEEGKPDMAKRALREILLRGTKPGAPKTEQEDGRTGTDGTPGRG